MRRFVVIVWHRGDGTKRSVITPSFIFSRLESLGWWAAAAVRGHGGDGGRRPELVRVTRARVVTEHHSPHGLRRHGVPTRAHALTRHRQRHVSTLLAAQLGVPFPLCVGGFVKKIDWILNGFWLKNNWFLAAARHLHDKICWNGQTNCLAFFNVKLELRASTPACAMQVGARICKLCRKYFWQ